MKIYIAGPMRGKPRYNFPAFDHAAGIIRAAGHEPVSPADRDRAMGFEPACLDEYHDYSKEPENLDMKAVIAGDIAALLQCDAIILLKGWEESQGARVEASVAEWAGIPRLDTFLSDYLHGLL